MNVISALGALAWALLGGGPSDLQNGGTIRLERGNLTVVLGSLGGVQALSDRVRGVTLTGRDAEAFRLVLRDGDNAIRLVRSGAQSPPVWTAGRDRATASWTGPLCDEAGVAHSISLRVTYALRGASGEEELRVWVSLENRSECTVLEVWTPAVGGLAALSGDVVAANPASRRKLALPFGDFAPHYPGAIPMAFLSIGEPHTLYFGAHESTARIKLLRVHEENGDIAARITHMPFVRPRGRFSSCAAVYRLCRGGYDEAGRIYRRWFVRTFGIKDPGHDWLRQQSFFQMTMVMLPEGNIHYRFRDIPRLAADAKKYGVTAIQIAGWQRGGHDNGYPYYEPDPRLGTWDDLRRAIAACHRMGVRVFFFVNLQVAMLDLEWYRRELHAYEAESEAGDPFWVAGWGMGTLASRMGLTTPLMAFLDPVFPRFSDKLLAYYRKLASIGADGVHVDKMFPQGLNANPRAPLPPDTSTWEGAIRFLQRMDRECRAINPEWRVSHECAWDRVLSIGTATWWAGNMSAVKRVFPETAETVGLYQPYDYAGVNNAVREGWVVMVAPYHFQRSMDEPAWRGLSRYVRDVKRIRDRLAGAVFLGERLPADAAALRTEPAACPWSVWRDPRTGRRVCIVTNGSDGAATITCSGWKGSRASSVRVHLPGREAVTLTLPATVEIAPERLAFFEELPAGKAVPARRAIRLPSRPEVRAARRPFPNATFEGGDLSGWQADPNWTVDDNRAGGWYSGWEGRLFAWSGKGGEARTGKLRSPVFVLDAAGVQVSVAGWSDIAGRTPDRWNYVTLNLETGEELARVYTPNTTLFTPMVLLAPRHRGKRVYIEAVDDAPEQTFSMICIDDVQLWDPEDEPEPRRTPAAGALVLENERYRIEIGRANGTIVRLLDKTSGEELIREPRLSDNWRISLPIRDAVAPDAPPFTVTRASRPPESWRNCEGNYIDGRVQRLTSTRRTGDGLLLRWDGPLTARDGRRYPVSVSMRIGLEGDAVRFQTTVHNRSRFEVGEVYAPILGGLQGLGQGQVMRRATELVVPQGGGYAASRPFHSFHSHAWLGIFGPEMFFAYPHALDAPWAALRLRPTGQLVYFACHDPVARLKVIHLEMTPGVSGARSSGNWPAPDELEGRPAGVRMSWTHLVYHPAGRDFETAPVVLRFLEGDISEATSYYGSWLRASGSLNEVRSRVPDHAVGRSRLDALAGVAREASAAGKRWITLTDWTRARPDAGVPLLEPDPELGGWDGLRSAVKDCAEAGVRVAVTVRMNPVAHRSPLLPPELRRSLCRDRWGVPQTVMGWYRGRVTAEMLVSGERRAYVNTGREEFRRWFVDGVERLARAGVAGLHVEGFFPSVLDFAPGSASTPDRRLCQDALDTLQAALVAARRHVPDFAITVDRAWDRLRPAD